MRHRCELHLVLLLFLFFDRVLQLSQANSFGSLTVLQLDETSKSQ